MFICQSCGYKTESWLGRCPQCQLWNAFKQDEEKSSEKVNVPKIFSISEIKNLSEKRLSTGIFQIDQILGGGLLVGSVILLSGEPGVGKSTLVLQAFSNLRTLYISGEESLSQLKNRVQRLGLQLKNFDFTEETNVENLEFLLKKDKKWDLIVVDSIQTVYTKYVAGPSGSISQIRESALKLIRIAKEKGISLILIGHITKEGLIAGPKILEHLVDIVIFFQGDQKTNFRVLRIEKNRFGSVDEVIFFEVSGNGLRTINNSVFFLRSKSFDFPGKTIIGVLEGNRPLFLEVECLVAPTNLSVPRRVIAGFDYNKALLILAVLKKNLNLPVDNFDLYLSIPGGFEIRSPAADLGIAASIISSLKNKPISKLTVFFGELSLLGEIRPVYRQEKLLDEAKKQGFKRIFYSENINSIQEIYQVFDRKHN